ncbi:MAG: hypothetical protein ACOX8I_10935 [Bacillota bacterium]|jgi:ribosomal protein S27AE
MDVPTTAFFPSEFKEHNCEKCQISYLSVQVPIADHGPVQPYMMLGCPRCGQSVVFDAHLESRYYEANALKNLPAELIQHYQKASAWEKARMIQELWLDSMDVCKCGGPFKIMIHPGICPKCGGPASSSANYHGQVRFMDSSAGIGPTDDYYLFARYSLSNDNGRRMAKQMENSKKPRFTV